MDRGVHHQGRQPRLGAEPVRDRDELERFSDALHAPRLSPPVPPLRKGGKVGGVWSFSPLAKGGNTVRHEICAYV